MVVMYTHISVQTPCKSVASDDPLLNDLHLQKRPTPSASIFIFLLSLGSETAYWAPTTSGTPTETPTNSFLKSLCLFTTLQGHNTIPALLSVLLFSMM